MSWSIRRAAPVLTGSTAMPSPIGVGKTAPDQRHRLASLAASPQAVTVYLVVAALLLLEALTRSGLVSTAIVARPSDAIADLFMLQRKVDFFGAFGTTASVTLAALALELLVAIPFGHFLFRHRTFGLAYTGWLTALFAAPIFLLYPLFLVIFGRNVITLIIMGFIPGVIPLVIHVQQGFLGVPRTLINVGDSFDLTRAAIFWKIMVPAAAPTIFTGFRLSLMYTLINVVAIEYLVDIGGLGRIVADRYFRFDISGTYAAIIAVMAISIFFNWLIGAVERRVRSR
jgi:NitT/TauT family transport system permease protein